MIITRANTQATCARPENTLFTGIVPASLGAERVSLKSNKPIPWRCWSCSGSKNFINAITVKVVNACRAAPGWSASFCHVPCSLFFESKREDYV